MGNKHKSNKTTPTPKSEDQSNENVDVCTPGTVPDRDCNIDLRPQNMPISPFLDTTRRVNYKVGDIYIESSSYPKRKDLVIIRYCGKIASSENTYFGIERFATYNGRRPVRMTINNRNVEANDGECDGVTYFTVQRKGHGQFIQSTSLHNEPVVWNVDKSNLCKELKESLCSKAYDQSILMSACKYGDLGLVKHMLSFCHSTEDKLNALLLESPFSIDEADEYCLPQEAAPMYQQQAPTDEANVYDMPASATPMTVCILFMHYRIVEYVLKEISILSDKSQSVFYSPQLINQLYRTGNIMMLKLFIQNDHWDEIPPQFEPANFQG
eukprot:1077798_1